MANCWMFIITTYSRVVTGIMMYLLKITIGIRVVEDEEPLGLDRSQHGDIAYFEYDSSPNRVDNNTGMNQIIYKSSYSE